MSKSKWKAMAFVLLLWGCVEAAVRISAYNRPVTPVTPDTLTVYLTETVVESVFVHTTQTDTIIIKGDSWIRIPGTRIPIFPKGRD